MLLLAPFAPHFAEELWENIGEKGSVFNEPWPVFDEGVLSAREKTIVIQINGKLKGQIKVSPDCPEEDVKQKAIAEVETTLAGREIKKTIYVPGKLVSIVV